jgi:hypothetical protein
MDYVEQSTENDDRHKTVQLSNEHGLPSDEEQLKVMNLNTYEEGLDADHIEDEPPDIFVPTADNGLSNDDYDIIFKQRHPIISQWKDSPAPQYMVMFLPSLMEDVR